MPDSKKEPSKVEDMLKTLYERNEHYHDVKERVVWLAGLFYLTFSAALITWFLEHKELIVENQLPLRQIAIFLVIVFLITATFIFRQTSHKVTSAVKTGQFNQLIRNLDDSGRRNYRALMNANDYTFNFCNFMNMGWSGHLVFGATYIFFLAQMVVLYGFCYWRATLGYWLWVFLLPYGFPVYSSIHPIVNCFYKCCGHAKRKKRIQKIKKWVGETKLP
jgi:hypothetical protein